MKVKAHQPHSWEEPSGRRSRQPDWLNNNGGTQSHCTKCGVTLHMDIQRVDLPSTYFTYVDALGRTFTSYVPLGCPAFLGDHAGTTMGNKERIRELDGRVEDVVAKTDNNQVNIEDHEQRLMQLEAENKRLKSRMDSAEADVGAVVLWLRQMVALHRAAGLPTTQVEVGGRQVALPGPVLDMIIEMGAVETPDGVEVFVPRDSST